MPRKIQPPKLKTSVSPRAFPRPAGTFAASLRKRQRHEGNKSRLSYVSNRLTDAAAAVSKMRRRQRKGCSNKPPSFRNSSEIEIDLADNSKIGQAVSTCSNQPDQDIEFDCRTEHCDSAKRIFSVQAKDSRTSLLNSRPPSPNSRKINICDKSIAACNHSPKNCFANDLENTEKPSFCQARDSSCEAIDPLMVHDQDYDDRVPVHIGLDISSGRSEDSDDAISIPSLSLEEVPTDATAPNSFEVHGLVTAEDLSHSKTQDFAASAIAWSALAALHGSLKSSSVLKDDLGSNMRKKGLFKNLWNDGELFDDIISLSCNESVSAASAGDGVVDDCSIPDLPDLFSDSDADSEVHCGTPLVEADNDMLKIDISAPSSRTVAETNKEKTMDSIIALSAFSALLSSPLPILVHNNNHKSKSVRHSGNLWLEKDNDSNTEIDIVSLSSGTNSDAESVTDVIDLNFIHHSREPEDLQCEDDLHSIPSLCLASKQTSFYVTDENTSICNFLTARKKPAKNGEFNGTLNSMTSIAVAAALLVSSNFVEDANVSSSRDVMSVDGMDIMSVSSNSEPEEDDTIESFIGTVYDTELHLIDDQPRCNLAANNVPLSVPTTQSTTDKPPGSVVAVDSLAATTTILSIAIDPAKTPRTLNECTKSQRNVWVGRMFDTEISISLSSDCDSLGDRDDENNDVNRSNLFIPAEINSRKDSIHHVTTQEINSIANCLSDESMKEQKTDVVSSWDDFTLSTPQSQDYHDGSQGHTEVGLASGQNEDSDDDFSIPSLSIDRGQGDNSVKDLEVHDLIANPSRLCSNPTNVAESAIAWSVLAALPGPCATLLTVKHGMGSIKRNKSLAKTLWNESGESDSLISLPYDEFVSAATTKEEIVDDCSISDLPELSSETYNDGMVHCRSQNLQPFSIVADNDMLKVDISGQINSTAGVANVDLSAPSSMEAKFERRILLKNDFDEKTSLSSDTDLNSLDSSLDGASMNHCEDAGFIGDIYIQDIEDNVSSQSVEEIEDAISMPSLSEVGHHYFATTVEANDFSRMKYEVDPHSEDVVESAIAWSTLATLLVSPVMSSAPNTQTVKSNNSAFVQSLWGRDESEDMISLACDDDLSIESDTIIFMDEGNADEDEASTSRLWWPPEDHVNKDDAITGVLASVDSIAALSALFNRFASESADEGPTSQVPQTIWLDDIETATKKNDIGVDFLRTISRDCDVSSGSNPSQVDNDDSCSMPSLTLDHGQNLFFYAMNNTPKHGHMTSKKIAFTGDGLHSALIACSSLATAAMLVFPNNPSQTNGSFLQNMTGQIDSDAMIDQNVLFGCHGDEITSLSSDTDLDSLNGSLDGASMNHCEDAGFIGDIYIQDIEDDVLSQSVEEIEDAISMPSLSEVGHHYFATTVEANDFSRMKYEVDPHSEDVVESAIAWSTLATLLVSPVMSSAPNTQTVKSNNSAFVQSLWGRDESEDMISLACDDDLSIESDTIIFMDEGNADEDEASTSRLWWPLDDHVNKDDAITGVLASVDSIAALSALFNRFASESADEGTVNPTNRILQTIWLDDVNAKPLADDVQDSVNARLYRERIADEDCTQNMCLADSQHDGDVDSEPSHCTILSQTHHVNCHPSSTDDYCYKSLLTQQRTFPMSDALGDSVLIFISLATWLGSCDLEQRQSKKCLDQDTVRTCCDNVRSNGNAVDIASMQNDHYINLLVQSEPAEPEQTNSTYSILPRSHCGREFYSYPKKASTATDDDGDDITVPMTPEKSGTRFGSQDISLDCEDDEVKKQLDMDVFVCRALSL